MKAPEMRMYLYAGLLVAAGLSVPVMAAAFDFGRFADETDGGIQVETGKTKSWLYTGHKNSTDGLTGFGVVTDKVTTGSVKTGTLGYDYEGGIADNYNALKDIRTTIDKGSTDKLFHNNDYEIVRTDPFPGKDGITKDYNSFTDWKGKTVNSDKFVKDSYVTSDEIARNPYDQKTVQGTGDLEKNLNDTNDYLTKLGDKPDTSDLEKNMKDTNEYLSKLGDKDKVSEEKKAYEAETDKLANKCKDAKVQSDSKNMAGSESSIKADLEKNGAEATPECMANAKKAFEACAKGDVEGIKKVWKEGEAFCKESPIDVATPSPTSKKTAETNVEPVLEGPVGLLDQAKNAVQKLLQLDANGQASPMQQMLLGMALQKVQEMMSGGGGGGGGGGDSNDDGYDDKDDVKLTCDKVTKTDRKTVVTYVDPKTGEKVEFDEKDTSDSKAASAAVKANGKIMPNFGDDAKKGDDTDDAKDKLIKVKTVLTSEQCKNGNLRIKAVETKTYPDGEVKTDKYEDIVSE